MEQKILVPSKYIVGYKDPDKLNLTNLPDVKPVVNNSICIGFVTFYNSKDGYGFIVTLRLWWCLAWWHIDTM
jgi:hypothetical protein